MPSRQAPNVTGLAIDTPTTAANKRSPAPKLQQQLEQLNRLPKAQQRLVSQVIESVLAQAGQ